MSAWEEQLLKAAVRVINADRHYAETLGTGTKRDETIALAEVWRTIGQMREVIICRP